MYYRKVETRFKQYTEVRKKSFLSYSGNHSCRVTFFPDLCFCVFVLSLHT